MPGWSRVRPPIPRVYCPPSYPSDLIWCRSRYLLFPLTPPSSRPTECWIILLSQYTWLLFLCAVPNVFLKLLIIYPVSLLMCLLSFRLRTSEHKTNHCALKKHSSTPSNHNDCQRRPHHRRTHNAAFVIVTCLWWKGYDKNERRTNFKIARAAPDLWCL